MKLTGSGCSTWRGLLLASLCCFYPMLVSAQIYQYQDGAGNWHFTDDPPERYEYSVVPDISTSIATAPDTEPSDDLAAHLVSVFNPSTPIAMATLSVVSIKTDSGEGSGFFCSEQGHILTAKHIVRPQAMHRLDDREKKTQNKEQDLRATAASLKETREQLRHMGNDLNGYQELIENSRDEKSRDWANDARERLSERHQIERDRVTGMERNVHMLGPEVESSRREMDSEHSLASTAKTHFDVVLKDGTELPANLVAISDQQDLALLKLDGYRTPFLRIHPLQPLLQGTRVLAMGNPLGTRDAVTSGVITQTTPERLLTDARILPGSSGAPLILESGAVIGVNVSGNANDGTPTDAADFAKAIPINLALEEFPTLMTAIDTEATDASEVWQLGSDWTESLGPDWTSGIAVEQARSNNSNRYEPGESSRGQPLSLGTSQNSEQTGIDTSAPVRLIIPGDDGDTEPKAVGQTSGAPPPSLDFPPEGSVNTPSVSAPRQ